MESRSFEIRHEKSALSPIIQYSVNPLDIPTMKYKKAIYFVLLSGATGLILSLYQAYQLAYPYYGFHEATATVLTVGVDSEMVSAGEGSTVRVYRPRVEREYSVDGVKFSGAQFSTSGSYFREKKDAEAFAAKFKPGDPVNVLYDPRNSERSFLLRDFDSSGFTLFVLTLFFSSMLMFLALREMNKTRVPTNGPMLARELRPPGKGKWILLR